MSQLGTESDQFVALILNIAFSGGSMSNIYAMNVARYYKHPEVKTKGLCGLQKQLSMFTSEKVNFCFMFCVLIFGQNHICEESTVRTEKPSNYWLYFYPIIHGTG